MTDPVLVEVTRGGVVESTHCGRYAVVGSGGELVASAGDIAEPVFPRSAIKAFQCLPALEAGVADAYGLNDAEIAIACASHNAEQPHVDTARSVLNKAGIDESAYECGAHWPSLARATRELAKAGEEPLAVHNNCSGKHALMLAFAKHLGVETEGYTQREHRVQQAVERVMAEMCEYDLTDTPCGVDGCSVPTWAIPLKNVALAFQKFASGEGLSEQRAAACKRIFSAVQAHPFMVAGSKRLCTKLMEEVPRAFVKIGAEGVYCAAVPHAGLGVAIKVDDGAVRATEVLVASVLAGLDCWNEKERDALESMSRSKLRNWADIEVGEVRALAAPVA